MKKPSLLLISVTAVALFLLLVFSGRHARREERQSVRPSERQSVRASAEGRPQHLDGVTNALTLPPSHAPAAPNAPTALAAFNDWVDAYLAAAPDTKAGLTSNGEQL